MASSKTGMSAHQLHRMLGVTYKTARFMAYRIREATGNDAPARMGGNEGRAGAGSEDVQRATLPLLALKASACPIGGPTTARTLMKESKHLLRKRKGKTKA